MSLATRQPLYLQAASHPQARACAACEVRSRALLGALDEDGLRHIHAEIASPVYAPGDRVYRGGDSGGAVYTVRAGIVRFERVTAGGQRRIVRLAGRGDLIGQEALVERPYSDEAIACTPLQLCRLPRPLIDRLARAEPGLQRELMQRWQLALEASEAWVSELTTGVARRRLLKLLALLDRLADDGGRLWLPRREDIGAMLDLTIETASRLISALRREAVLELLPPQAARVDRAALAAALQQQDAG